MLNNTIIELIKDNTHPQQPATIKRAGIVSGAAAARYEEAVKLPRYLQECSANNLNFISMVVETFGTWCRRAEPVLKFIARRQPSTRRIQRITLNPFFVLLST